MAVVPFFCLLISEAAKEDRKIAWLYWLALLYSVGTGFIAAYYFHVAEAAIWKNTAADFLRAVKFW
jgi:hypothetical protein